MPKPLIPTEYRKFTAGTILRVLAVNAAINTLIALLLVAIGFGSGFAETFIFSQCIGMSILLANIAAMPLFRTASRTVPQVLIIAAAVVAGATVGTIVGAAANGFRPLLFLREHASFFFQIVLIGLLFGGIISYVFISLAKLSEEKMRRLEAEKSAVVAELQLLQSQMEPHFLFNTLANIRSLIESDPRKAGAMLESFAAFVRASLRTSRERTVTLMQEMEIVRSYLELFSVRMGERLRYRIELPDGLREVPVPPLLVQPLVENAVKHGLEPSVPGGEIVVSAQRSGDIVRIVVADTGKGIGETGSGNGIGLENIRKRLELAFGERARVVLEPNGPTGVRATIELPYSRD